MNVWRSDSEAETRRIAARLAAGLVPGAVLLLQGDLGAGKTAFVRGLAEGLGVPEDDVTSPTFTLVHEYRRGRLPLFHVDLYRLSDGVAVEDLGVDDTAADGVLAIEWPERLARPMRGASTVRIDIIGDTARSITIE